MSGEQKQEQNKEQRQSVVYSRRLPADATGEDVRRQIHHIQERSEFTLDRLLRRDAELEKRIEALEKQIEALTNRVKALEPVEE